MSETAEFLHFAIELADLSRAMLLEVMGEKPVVSIKSDASYVTETDRAIEAALRERIEVRFPQHGISGEEYGICRDDAEFVWVLDPIDGTAPFVAGIPVYGTLISVARRGAPYIGVIEHPATSDRWVGVAGEESYLNGRKISVRRGTPLADALMTCSNPDYFDDVQRSAFDKARDAVRYTQYGGSCYAYGVLASGRTDVAIDAGMDTYDMFAPAAVILGAGGAMTDWHGYPLTLDWSGLVLATGDPLLHETMLRLVQA